MDEETLKLAEKHCYSQKSGRQSMEIKEIGFFPEGLEAFYKDAFNAGLEAAAHHVSLGFYHDQATAIRALKEMK